SNASWNHNVVLHAEIILSGRILPEADNSHLLRSKRNVISADGRHKTGIAKEQPPLSTGALRLRQQRQPDALYALRGIHDSVNTAVAIQRPETIGLHITRNPAECLDSSFCLEVKKQRLHASKPSRIAISQQFKIPVCRVDPSSASHHQQER